MIDTARYLSNTKGHRMEVAKVRNSETIALAMLAIVLAAPSAAAGRENRCDPAVRTELDRLQIDSDDVGAVSYQVRTHENSRGNTYVDRLLAWVDLRSCTGKLVIELSPRCRIKQAYTTDSCSLSGVPGY